MVTTRPNMVKKADAPMVPPCEISPILPQLAKCLYKLVKYCQSVCGSGC